MGGTPRVPSDQRLRSAAMYADGLLLTAFRKPHQLGERLARASPPVWSGTCSSVLQALRRANAAGRGLVLSPSSRRQGLWPQVAVVAFRLLRDGVCARA